MSVTHPTTARRYSALLECSVVEPVTPDIVANALNLENEVGLSPQDATVYATVLQHLRTSGDEPKVFATQNTSDFANPTIEDQLAKHNCKLLGNFGSAEKYIQSILGEISST